MKVTKGKDKKKIEPCKQLTLSHFFTKVNEKSPKSTLLTVEPCFKVSEDNCIGEPLLIPIKNENVEELESKTPVFEIISNVGEDSDSKMLDLNGCSILAKIANSNEYQTVSQSSNKRERISSPEFIPCTPKHKPKRRRYNKENNDKPASLNYFKSSQSNVRKRLSPIDNNKPENQNILCNKKTDFLSETVSSPLFEDVDPPSPFQSNSCIKTYSKKHVNLSRSIKRKLEKNSEFITKSMSDIEDHCSPAAVVACSTMPQIEHEASKTSFLEDAIDDLELIFNEDWNGVELNQGLKLDNFQYCEVTSYDQFDNYIRLGLKSFDKIKQAISSTSCFLSGYWLNSRFLVGDMVSVKARYNTLESRWIIDDNFGFVIKFPDTLISGTTVAGTLFCMRRSVLSTMCPIYESSNSVLIIGSLVHELFQEVLKQKVQTLDKIKEIADRIEKNQLVMRQLYESDTPVSFLKKELNFFVNRIYSFVNMYVKPTITNSIKDKKTWSGEILKINDVEENFWIPSLGIKGKSDVTAVAFYEGKKKTIPLELKTGRVSYSAEHRGQLLLYCMMMSQLGYDVDAGLLLYLRDNTIQQINVNHRECSGLIMLRNDLVTYMKANENIIDECFSLPEPINHFGCPKCPYLTLCSAALKKEKENGVNLNVEDRMSGLAEMSTKHLTKEHVKYFFHWVKLLKMENVEQIKKRVDLADIWQLKPEHRKTRGNSINEVCIIGDVRKEGNRFVHCMASKCQTVTDLTKQVMIAGDFIVVSTNTRYAVSLGTVLHVNKLQIMLLLDRDLTEAEDSTFHIDLYSTDISMQYSISNLRLLLDDTNDASQLRSVIIDKQLPSFSPVDWEIVNSGKDLLSRLNSAQQKAIHKVLTTSHYALIKGMPGTGKTDTIVTLIKFLVQLGQSVLVTSQTHSAIDNILLRLRGEVDFLRLGSSLRVHPLIQEHCDENILAKNTFNSVEEIKQFYDSKPVVGITCMNCIRHTLLRKRKFDYCIVDEATQVLQPLVLSALISANKFVLVGDPDQLPPVVLNKEASSLGLNESLFKRLDRPAVTSLLHLQYRMNKQIMHLANCFTYKGLLQCGNEHTELATIQITTKINEEQSWLKRVLSDDPNYSVIVIDTSRIKLSTELQSTTTDYSNRSEGDLVMTIVNALKRGGLDDSCIGVIASYRTQVALLKQLAEEKKHKIEVNTIDQYQGRDKDVILYSCTRNTETKEGDILNDKRRLTVAITRAKVKLIIIGNMDVMKTYSTFAALLSSIPKANFCVL